MAPRKTSRPRPIADPKPLPGDWLTAAEIIDLPIPAIQYKTFEQWRAGKRQGELQFPEEDHTFGSVPVWHLSRVEAWLEATGKRYDLRVWRLKLELGSYRRLGLNQNNQPSPDKRVKIPAKRKVPGNWVTIPEIADLPKPPVLVTTVEQWRQRHDIHAPIPFPVPDDYRGMFPVWRIERMLAWLEQMNKPCGTELLMSKREADLYLRPSGVL
jgi:hypothetical protein